MCSLKIVQEQASDFNEELRKYALKESETFVALLNENPDYDPSQDETGTLNNDDLILLLGEKEQLPNVLESSKEFIENKINERETDIKKAI